jgi:hypothetical protein
VRAALVNLEPMPAGPDVLVHPQPRARLPVPPRLPPQPRRVRLRRPSPARLLWPAWPTSLQLLLLPRIQPLSLSPRSRLPHPLPLRQPSRVPEGRAPHPLPASGGVRNRSDRASLRRPAACSGCPSRSSLPCRPRLGDDHPAR